MTTWTCSVMFWCVILVEVLHRLVVANHDAKRLYDDLLRKKNYNKLIRPVGNASDKLTVRMGLKLSQIIDVDEKNEIITTNVWMVQEWEDYSLRWNPVEYGGVTNLYVPSETLWLPDIVLYNNADGDYNVTLMTKATLLSHGMVRWEPPAIYKSQCDINVRYFPFDEQTCRLKFGSWTYDGEQVDLKHIWAGTRYHIQNETDVLDHGMDTNDYYTSTEWDLMEVPAKKNIKYYPCCNEPYPDITFKIRIKRKTKFYTVNLIIPTVSICFLTTLTFYLPADSGEKISLCISILLSLSLFQLLLMELVPATSITVPLLGSFILFTMLLVFISVFVSVMTLNVNFRSSTMHRMGSVMKFIFIKVLPRILMLPPTDILEKVKKEQRKRSKSCDEERAYDWPEQAHDLSQHPFRRKFRRDEGGDSTIGNSLNTNYGLRTSFIGQNSDLSHFCDACSQRKTSRYCPVVSKGLESVNFITTHVKEEDDSQMIKDEWKYVALVIDRLLFIIYIIVCFGGSSALLFQPPTLYDNSEPITGQGIPFK